MPGPSKQKARLPSEHYLGRVDKVLHWFEGQMSPLSNGGPSRRPIPPRKPGSQIKMGKFSIEEGEYGSSSSFGDEPYYLSQSPVEFGKFVDGTWVGSGNYGWVRHPNNFGVHLEGSYCIMVKSGGEWFTDSPGISVHTDGVYEDEPNKFNMGGKMVNFIGTIDFDGAPPGSPIQAVFWWDTNNWRLVSQICYVEE